MAPNVSVPASGMESDRTDVKYGNSVNVLYGSMRGALPVYPNGDYGRRREVYARLSLANILRHITVDELLMDALRKRFFSTSTSEFSKKELELWMPQDSVFRVVIHHGAFLHRREAMEKSRRWKFIMRVTFCPVDNGGSKQFHTFICSLVQLPPRWSFISGIYFIIVIYEWILMISIEKFGRSVLLITIMAKNDQKLKKVEMKETVVCLLGSVACSDVTMILAAPWMMGYDYLGETHAKKLHAHIIIMGFQQEELYLRKLVTFCAISNPPSINYARRIFDHIEYPSTFIYNTMIRGYATSEDPDIAVNLYNQMVNQGIPADKYTFPFLLKACSNLPSLPKGEETHCRVIKQGFNHDVFVQNSLIHLYGCNSKIRLAQRIFDGMSGRDIASWTSLLSCCAAFGSVEEARRLFDHMPQRSVVSFSAMIAGYVQHGQYKEALCLFRDLQLANLEPNDSILVSVLCACSNLGALDSGKWIHSYIQQQKGKDLDSRITTALIDMYCKCGSIENAIPIFFSAEEKHVGEWTAMISGLGVQGYGEKSINLFEKMIKSGVKPNIVTFVALLSACTHAGLVEDGVKYFERMEREFGMTPTVEHYGCLIDLLGRGGFIEEAMEVVRRMPMEPNAAIWGAIFNACRVHKNVRVGELAAQKLINKEPWNGAVYMALMSLYAGLGRGRDVERVKKSMHEAACRKNPGCSLVEANGACHEFVAYDQSHPKVLEVCVALGRLFPERFCYLGLFPSICSLWESSRWVSHIGSVLSGDHCMNAVRVQKGD
ncbi:hypothetical protein H6P81_002298 [Aristolochia fimbriata]|uniref:Pentatricopeptide repeat-containing protein n=1 Tax=Aristolochia fimbriata TaxID=158543 RepID=A0AAV7F9E6_ARIFI|nr:hypothetical protein H6P81_002298 [Aristolochia fimbriata]